MSSTTSRRLKRVWELLKWAKTNGADLVLVADLEAALTGGAAAPDRYRDFTLGDLPDEEPPPYRRELTIGFEGAYNAITRGHDNPEENK